MLHHFCILSEILGSFPVLCCKFWRVDVTWWNRLCTRTPQRLSTRQPTDVGEKSMEKWSSIIDSSNYIQCLEGQEKVAKGNMLCMQNGNCFFLPAPPLFLHNLYHTQQWLLAHYSYGLLQLHTVQYTVWETVLTIGSLCSKNQNRKQLLVPEQQKGKAWWWSSIHTLLPERILVLVKLSLYHISRQSSPHFSQWGCQVHNSFLPPVKERKNSILFLYAMLSSFLSSKLTS